MGFRDPASTTQYGEEKYGVNGQEKRILNVRFLCFYYKMFSWEQKVLVFLKYMLNLEILCVLDLMIEMEDQTNDINEAGIPVLDYKTYTDRVFFLPSKDGEKDVMITGKLDIPEARRQTMEQALNQFSNLLNSKSFLINVSIEGEVTWKAPGTSNKKDFFFF